MNRILKTLKWDARFDVPKDILGFHKWLQDEIDKIPHELHTESEIAIWCREDYGDTFVPTIEISYIRDETPEEVSARKAREEADKAARIKSLEDELNRLRPKVPEVKTLAQRFGY